MRTSLAIIILFVCIDFAIAQQNFAGLSFKAYDPISSMDKNIDAVPLGLSLNYLRSFSNSRFSLGGEFGIAMYTSNDYTLTYKGTNIKVNEEDCFWTLHAISRYDIVRNSAFIAYAEARIGMTTFFSSIIAHEEDTAYPGEFNFHGTAFNTGLGGGVMFRPNAIFRESVNEHGLWINLGANYHTGSHTSYRYVPEGGPAIALDKGDYASLTHYIGYKLGIQFRF